MHQKSQDQPRAKVEPDRRTTAPDSRAHAVRRRHQPRRPPDAKIRAVSCNETLSDLVANKVARRIVTKPSGEFGLCVNLERGFKCPIRSTLQIRCRRTALRARQSRIRANADYRKALDSPSERTAAAARSIPFTAQLRQLLFFGQLSISRGQLIDAAESRLPRSFCERTRLSLNHMPDQPRQNPHHARVTPPKTRRAANVNKRAQGSFGYLIRPPLQCTPHYGRFRFARQ